MPLRFLPLRFTDATVRAHFAKPVVKIRAQERNRLRGKPAAMPVIATGCLSIPYDYILHGMRYVNLRPAEFRLAPAQQHLQWYC